MSQDTRKDKRAKVVSLNVRYKSATVDEFIENHSHDVSKGGLFVKTPTPFPPGTLLKFEIRLAGDKSVISGVGRVVWKREPFQAGSEKPAGMGVKFIKIDDSSRAIIDRLITQKADAGSAYTSETPIEEAPAGHPSTLRGLVAAPSVEPGAPPGPSPVNVPAPTAGAPATKLPVPPPAVQPPPVAKNPAAAGARPGGLPNVPPSVVVPPPAPSSKSGLGGPKPALPRPAAAPPNKPASPGGVVPASASSGATAPVAPISASAAAVNPQSEPKVGAARVPPPGRKHTIMGMGSASTPPTPNAPAAPAPANARPAATAEPMFPRMDPDSGSEPARDQTVMKQAAELLEEALKEAGGSLDEIGQNPLFTQTGEATADAPASKGGGGQVPAVQSGDTMIMASPMMTAGLSPSAPSVATGASSVRAGSSPSQPLILDAAPAVAPRPPLREDLDRSKKKGGSAGLLVGLLFVFLLIGGGVYAWQTGLLAAVSGPAPTSPSASTSPRTPTSSPPSSASGAAMMATTDAATEAKDASTASTTTDAAATETTADAGKVGTTATATAEKPPAPPKPAWRPPPPKPPPAPPTATATAEPPPTATPEPPPPAPPAPPAAPKPTMTSDFP